MLSDEGRRGQNHLRGQGQEPEKPRVPVFLRLQGPHAQGSRHGGKNRRLRHHARVHGDGGLRAGVQPDQAAHAPLQHPPQGRQGLSLHPRGSEGRIPAHRAGAAAGAGRRALFRPLSRRDGGARGHGRAGTALPAAHLRGRRPARPEEAPVPAISAGALSRPLRGENFAGGIPRRAGQGAGVPERTLRAGDGRAEEPDDRGLEGHAVRARGGAARPAAGSSSARSGSPSRARATTRRARF